MSFTCEKCGEEMLLTPDNSIIRVVTKKNWLSHLLVSCEHCPYCTVLFLETSDIRLLFDLGFVLEFDGCRTRELQQGWDRLHRGEFHRFRKMLKTATADDFRR